MLFPAKKHLWKLGLFSSEAVLFRSLFPPAISNVKTFTEDIFFFCEVIFCQSISCYSDALWYLIKLSIVQPRGFYLLSRVFFSTIVSVFMAINIFADALYEPQQYRTWQTQCLQFLCATVGRVQWAESRAALSCGVGNVLVCRMLCPSVLHQNGIYSSFTGVCYKLYRNCSFCTFIHCLGKV